MTSCLVDRGRAGGLARASASPSSVRVVAVRLLPAFLLAAFIVTGFLCGGCAAPAGGGGRYEPPAEGRYAYLVAADHPAATAAGMEILALGGNAIDAAVAISFALGVVRPEDCGLGGGGFALYQTPGEEPVAVDFREEAPAGVDRALYLDRDGRPLPDRTTVGPWAVGIPGQVRGALDLWQRFGSRRLSLDTVLAPAIRLAEGGFPVDAHLSQAMGKLAETYRTHPEYLERYGETYRVFLKSGGVSYEVGERLVRPDLARTLRTIVLAGADVFYRGDVAQEIVREIGRLGGTLSIADLADYRARFGRPLRGDVHEHTIYAPPPPSSGGVVLLEILNVLELAETRGRDVFRPHFLAEAMKHAFNDRAAHLGDQSGAVSDAVKEMLSRTRAQEILAAIDPQRVQKTEASGPVSLGSGGTSHFCVVDAAGGVVSWTESVNLGFGSLVTVPGTGIVLNNTLDDFALTTADGNAFGLRQGRENLLRPGARPLSSMTPVIVWGSDGLRLVAGASGGPKIITAVLHLLVATLWDGWDAERAVRRGRYHHQWLPDILLVEPRIDPAILRGLLERGHTVRAYQGARAGCVQAVELRGGRLKQVIDGRKTGR